MRAFREGSGLCLVQESRGDPPMEGVLLPPLESETGMLGNVPVSRQLPELISVYLRWI